MNTPSSLDDFSEQRLSTSLSQEDVETTLRVLQILTQDPGACSVQGTPGYSVREGASRFLRATRKVQRGEARQRDREILDTTGIRCERSERDFERSESFGEDLSSALLTCPQEEPILSTRKYCYVCKKLFTRVHHFYDSMCPECAAFNWQKRQQSADLSGRWAFLTGGRVKIGYQIGLKLLRAGASVWLTTRFPADAARRYATERDFDQWSHRLQIFPLDMRNLKLVEQFGAHLARALPRLDIVVNNAAQTVRRPPAFFSHLLEGERLASSLPSSQRKLLGQSIPAQPSLGLADPGPREALAPPLPPGREEWPWSVWATQIPLLANEGSETHFPSGSYDRDGQQVDLRPSNSWASHLGDISTVELLEVQSVNCLAPFLLLRCLEPLLFDPAREGKYVVNVSAVEGQFSPQSKSARHPHTNMAKAALNMITRTCAEHYASRGVYMNSVDTGWISNEAPHPRREQMHREGFREPLDNVDGAARVLDPVFLGYRGEGKPFGLFLKDYRPAEW